MSAQNSLTVCSGVNLAYQQHAQYVAVKIHPTRDYWLYVPLQEKNQTSQQQNKQRQLCFWDDAA